MKMKDECMCNLENVLGHDWIASYTMKQKKFLDILSAQLRIIDNIGDNCLVDGGYLLRPRDLYCKNYCIYNESKKTTS